MDKTLVIFGALLVISLLLGAGMVVTSASNAGFTKESAIKTASDFLNNEATYKFDGMHGTMTMDAQKVELRPALQDLYRDSGVHQQAGGLR